MEPNADQPKAPESKPGSKPNAKDDLKSLPLPEVHFLEGCRAHFATIPKNIFARKDNAMVRESGLKKLAGINLEFPGIH